jgi:hypothetical protein
VEWRQTGDIVVRRPSGEGESHQTEAVKAWEHPAHGRPIGRLFDLVGDRLASGGKLLAQAVLGQAVDEQAQHQDQAERHDALGLLHKDRGRQEERGFEKTEAPLHAVLVFVGADEFLVGELVRREPIRRDEDGRLALHRAGHSRRLEGDRGGDLPLGPVRRRALAWACWSVRLGMRDEVRLHREPLRALLEVLGLRCWA